MQRNSLFLSQLQRKATSERATEDGLWTCAAASKWLQMLSHVTVLESQASSQTGIHLLSQEGCACCSLSTCTIRVPSLLNHDSHWSYLQLGQHLPSDQLTTKNMERYSPEKHFSGVPHVNVTFVYVPAFRFGRWTGFRSCAACFTWISLDVYFYPTFTLTHHNSDKTCLCADFRTCRLSLFYYYCFCCFVK